MDSAVGQMARVTATELGRAWNFTDSTRRPVLSLGVKKALDVHSQVPHLE